MKNTNEQREIDKTGVNHPLEAWTISITLGLIHTGMLIFNKIEYINDISQLSERIGYCLGLSLAGVLTFILTRLVFLFFKTDSNTKSKKKS